jgi:hypothetical protein
LKIHFELSLQAALEFEIPEQVLQQTLDIAKLTKIGQVYICISLSVYLKTLFYNEGYIG